MSPHYGLIRRKSLNLDWCMCLFSGGYALPSGSPLSPYHFIKTLLSCASIAQALAQVLSRSGPAIPDSTLSVF